MVKGTARFITERDFVNGTGSTVRVITECEFV
jgi:hypothetical protein